MKTILSILLVIFISQCFAQGNDSVEVTLKNGEVIKAREIEDADKGLWIKNEGSKPRFIYKKLISTINGTSIKAEQPQTSAPKTKPVYANHFRNSMQSGGNLLIAAGLTFTIGFGLSIANIKLENEGLSYVSAGAYGLTGIFILSAGVNFVKASKAKQLTFKNNTHLHYGMVDHGVGMKYRF